MIKVALVDDQELITEGLKRILESYDEIKVIAIGKSGTEAVEIARAYRVDVMVMDIRMPNMNGVEAMKVIKKEHPEIKTVMLTTFEDEEYIVEAVKEGTNGYLYKDIPYDQLVQCIKEVSKGQFVAPQKVAQVLVKSINEAKAPKKDENPYKFTDRELQIVDMIKDGFNNRQIAHALYISEGTVKNYVSNIYAKTGTNNRVEIATLLKA